jgi:hypothetical protein
VSVHSKIIAKIECRANGQNFNSQEQEALASRRLAAFLADTSATSISSNTCGQTTAEKSISYMAEKIEDFDRMFGEKVPRTGKSEERAAMHGFVVGTQLL